MKKKILLGSIIIAIMSLQALGGFTGIDNLSSEPYLVRMILQNKKTTEWRNLNANPTGKTDQRGSKTVFNNINSKNVKIQWKSHKGSPFSYITGLIGDARDIYISNNGRCQIYEWRKSYKKAAWNQALITDSNSIKAYPGYIHISNKNNTHNNVRVILQNGKTTKWKRLIRNSTLYYSKSFYLEDYRNVKIEWEPVMDSNKNKPNFIFVTAPMTNSGPVYIYNNGNYQKTFRGSLMKASKINKKR